MREKIRGGVLRLHIIDGKLASSLGVKAVKEEADEYFT